MQVSKAVVAGAGVTIVALVATVFFLLGRDTGRRHARVAGEPGPVLVAAAPAPVALPPTPEPVAPPPTPAPPPPVLPAPAQPPAWPEYKPPAAAVVPGAAAPTEATAVREYFAKMQAIQEVAPSADTGEFANKLLTGAMQGDTSGFDGVITLAEDGARRAAEIKPPAACASYHAHMLAMLAESTDMMRKLKTAMASNDANALTTIAGTGSMLKSRTDLLQSEERAIKSRFGIAP